MITMTEDKKATSTLRRMMSAKKAWEAREKKEKKQLTKEEIERYISRW